MDPLVRYSRHTADAGVTARGLHLPGRTGRPRCQRVHVRAGLSGDRGHHRDLDLPDPIRQESVRQVRRGLRRTLGIAACHPAHPLDLVEITATAAAIDPTTLTGARDRALVLLGYACALRPGELAALSLADLQAQPSGLLLHVRRSKTDQEAGGQVVAVASVGAPPPARWPLWTPGCADAATPPDRSSLRCATSTRKPASRSPRTRLLRSSPAAPAPPV